MRECDVLTKRACGATTPRTWRASNPRTAGDHKQAAFVRWSPWGTLPRSDDASVGETKDHFSIFFLSKSFLALWGAGALKAGGH